MKTTLTRSVLLVAAAWCLGIFVNQIYSQGIRWFLLKPALATREEGAVFRFINADSAFQFMGDEFAAFVDVRPAEEFDLDHLPGAISIPWQQFLRDPGQVHSLRRYHQLIIYCFDPDCFEATALAKELTLFGFERVFVLFGGMAEWLEQGFPVEKAEDVSNESF